MTILINSEGRATPSYFAFQKVSTHRGYYSPISAYTPVTYRRLRGFNWKRFQRLLADLLTRLPYTRFSSRLCDRILLASERGGEL